MGVFRVLLGYRFALDGTWSVEYIAQGLGHVVETGLVIPGRNKRMPFADPEYPFAVGRLAGVRRLAMLSS